MQLTSTFGSVQGMFYNPTTTKCRDELREYRSLHLTSSKVLVNHFLHIYFQHTSREPTPTLRDAVPSMLQCYANGRAVDYVIAEIAAEIIGAGPVLETAATTADRFQLFLANKQRQFHFHFFFFPILDSILA